MSYPGQVDIGNEGVATKKGGHMEYALAHTPILSYLILSYLISSYLISSYLISSYLTCHVAVDVGTSFVDDKSSSSPLTRHTTHSVKLAVSIW